MLKFCSSLNKLNFDIYKKYQINLPNKFAFAKVRFSDGFKGYRNGTLS